MTTPNHVSYFQISSPSNATRLNLRIVPSAGFNGWLRLESGSYLTLATTFLAPAGQIDGFQNLPIAPSQDCYVSVAGVNGSVGTYTLEVDFNPDDPGLPQQITPPSSVPALVPYADGTLHLSDQAISSPSQFAYYVFYPRITGDYTFETNGDLDTQLGVYVGNGTFIVSDDDSGAGSNARLTTTLSANNYYYVVVRAESTQTGTYELNVVGQTESAGTMLPLGLGLLATGPSEFYGGSVHYAHTQVTAPTNTTSMSVRAAVESGWPNLDVVVRVSDEFNNVLATANNSGAGADELLPNIPVTAGKTYFIATESKGTGQGYSHVVVDFDPDTSITSGVPFPVGGGSPFGEQQFADVAMTTGGSVAVWSDTDVVNGFAVYEIRASAYGANGQAVGGQIRINQQNLTGLTHPQGAWRRMVRSL